MKAVWDRRLIVLDGAGLHECPSPAAWSLRSFFHRLCGICSTNFYVEKNTLHVESPMLSGTYRNSYCCALMYTLAAMIMSPTNNNDSGICLNTLETRISYITFYNSFPVVNFQYLRMNMGFGVTKGRAIILAVQHVEPASEAVSL
jgi:hypothetical protein